LNLKLCFGHSASAFAAQVDMDDEALEAPSEYKLYLIQVGPLLLCTQIALAASLEPCLLEPCFCSQEWCHSNLKDSVGNGLMHQGKS
jgi:hypothetical protein